MSIFKKINKENLNLIIKKKNLICFFLIVILFFFDRITKTKLIKKLINDPIYINDYMNLDLIWNTGIGFGLLSSNTNLIYNSITGIIGIVILFIIYLIFTAKYFDKILLSIVLAGALGNFYDRLVYLAVPDFIDIHYNTFHWFTFNIADILITIGIAILISKDLFFKNEKN